MSKIVFSKAGHSPNLLVLGLSNKDIFTEAMLWECERNTVSIMGPNVMSKKLLNNVTRDSFIEGSGLDGLAVIATYRQWWEDVQKYAKGDVK